MKAWDEMNTNSHCKSLIFSLLILLTSCGGGGDTNLVEVSGTALDGYLKNALVCLDLNTDMTCDSNEPSARTDLNGDFSYRAPLEQVLFRSTLVQIIPGETIDMNDPSSSISQGYILVSIRGEHKIVSPMTTLVANKMSAGFDRLTAETLIGSSMGVYDILSNYLNKKGDNYICISKIAASVTELLKIDYGRKINERNYLSLSNLQSQVDEIILPNLSLIKVAANPNILRIIVGNQNSSESEIVKQVLRYRRVSDSEDLIVGIRDYVYRLANRDASNWRVFSPIESFIRLDAGLISMLCGDLSSSYVWILRQFDLQARTVQLATREFVEGRDFYATHVSVEVFDPKRQKWIVSDPTFNASFSCGDSMELLNFTELRRCKDDGGEITVRENGGTYLRGQRVVDYYIAYDKFLYAMSASKVDPTTETLAVPNDSWLLLALRLYQIYYVSL
jgi:hypothetical protein